MRLGNDEYTENEIKKMPSYVISGPNENSQKASISVNVLAANSQDEVYE